MNTLQKTLAKITLLGQPLLEGSPKAFNKYVVQVEAVPKTRILRIEIFDSELYGNVSHSIPSKTLYKASFRYKYNRVRQRSMVELYLNMQNKRKADGVIDIEIAQNPLKTVFITAL